MNKITIIKKERGIDEETFIPYVDVTIRMNLEVVTDISRIHGHDSICDLIGSEIIRELGIK